MTLLMRDKENKKHAKIESKVESIRNAIQKDLPLDQCGMWLNIPQEFVEAVVEAIQNHPDLDDEAITDQLSAFWN